MSYEATVLEREAARPTTDKRSATTMLAVARLLRKRYSVYEEQLISRLTVIASLLSDDDRLLRFGVPLEVVVATLAEESGGYRHVRRVNTDGSIDLGVCQINSIHGVPDVIRLSIKGSLDFVLDKLMPRRLAAAQHPLADFNAFTSGRYMSKMTYAVEACNRALKKHPNY